MLSGGFFFNPMRKFNCRVKSLIETKVAKFQLPNYKILLAPTKNIFDNMLSVFSKGV